MRPPQKSAYAIGVRLGPGMDSAVGTADAGRPSLRMAQALELCKFDRVAEVRKRATAALAVMAQIQVPYSHLLPP